MPIYFIEQTFRTPGFSQLRTRAFVGERRHAIDEAERLRAEIARSPRVSPTQTWDRQVKVFWVGPAGVLRHVATVKVDGTVTEEPRLEDAAPVPALPPNPGYRRDGRAVAYLAPRNPF